MIIFKHKLHSSVTNLQKLDFLGSNDEKLALALNLHGSTIRRWREGQIVRAKNQAKLDEAVLDKIFKGLEMIEKIGQ